MGFLVTIHIHAHTHIYIYIHFSLSLSLSLPYALLRTSKFRVFSGLGHLGLQNMEPHNCQWKSWDPCGERFFSG